MFINNLFIGEKEPDAIVGGAIAIYENAWPDPELTIARLESATSDNASGVAWQRAGTFGGGVNQDHRTNLNLDITHTAQGSKNAVAMDIHNQFYFLLVATTVPYATKFNINENFYHESYQALKYREGDGYKDHYDGGTDIGRSISAICYLNDDYKGGEIEFPNYNVKIKPEKGMLILFPSNYAYRHIAHTVEEGTKYSLVCWIHDRPIND